LTAKWKKVQSRQWVMDFAKIYDTQQLLLPVNQK
jgi:hypothetical protein